jgi:hypothetical protein
VCYINISNFEHIHGHGLSSTRTKVELIIYKYAHKGSREKVAAAAYLRSLEELEEEAELPNNCAHEDGRLIGHVALVREVENADGHVQTVLDLVEVGRLCDWRKKGAGELSSFYGVGEARKGTSERVNCSHCSATISEWNIWVVRIE